MTKRFIFSALLVAFWLSAFCQQPHFLGSCFNYGGVRSYDDANVVFDKAHLENVLKDKRFVLLGDQTHREGSVISMKIQLIKILHEEMGYNFLAFEDDFFSLYRLDQQIRNGNFPEDIPGYFSPIFSENDEFQELIDYLKESHEKGKPLFVVGFDSQIFGENNDSLILALSEHLESKNCRLTEEEQEFLRIELAEVSGFPHEGNPLADKDKDFKFDSLLGKIKKAGFSESAESNDIFWNQIVFLIEQTFEMSRIVKVGKEEPAQNFRDRMMAENFKFLANQYKDEKIISWGASYHFASNLNRSEASPITDRFAKRMAELQHETDNESIYPILEEAVTMGDILKDAYDDEVYALAFITGGGSYGIPNQSPIPILPLPEGSIEHWLRVSSKGAVWVDLAHSSSCSNFLATPLGHLPIYAPWHEVFDGFLYLPMVEPLTARKPASRLTYPSLFKLRGKVIDVTGNEAIPFAHIIVNGRAEEGSATNEGGNFELALELNGSDTLKVSSLGYEAAFVPLGTDTLERNGELIIRLQPTSFLLDEVVVSAGGNVTPEGLMKKVIVNLKKNYPQKDVFLELFLRRKLYEEGQLIDKKEVVMDYYSPNGYKVKGYDLKAYNNSHFAKVKHIRDFNLENPLGMPYLDLMNLDIVGGTKDLFKLAKLKNYTFEIEDMTSYDGMPVYVVFFKDKVTRPIKAYNYTSHYSGRLYIDAENYAILKYESTWERVLPNLSTQGIQGEDAVGMTHQRFDIQTTYQEHQGNYQLKTGKITHSTNLSDQIKSSVVEFLTTAVKYDSEVGDMVRFTELPVHEPQYDPGFWEKYNILIDE